MADFSRSFSTARAPFEPKRYRQKSSIRFSINFGQRNFILMDTIGSRLKQVRGKLSGEQFAALFASMLKLFIGTKEEPESPVQNFSKW